MHTSWSEPTATSTDTLTVVQQGLHRPITAAKD
ncbi:hypothetical protein PF003_g20429 [Phytophthora fragariae]|nr:hypothetical protein PF003_g20429 [Phytophthora fragariae]